MTCADSKLNDLQLGDNWPINLDTFLLSPMLMIGIFFIFTLKIFIKVTDIECQNNKSTQWSSNEKKWIIVRFDRTSAMICSRDGKKKQKQHLFQWVWLHRFKQTSDRWGLWWPLFQGRFVSVWISSGQDDSSDQTVPTQPERIFKIKANLQPVHNGKALEMLFTARLVLSCLSFVQLSSIGVSSSFFRLRPNT